MVAERENIRSVLRSVGQNDIAEADRGVGIVYLELIAEAASDIALGSEPNPSCAALKAKISSDDRIVGVR